LKNFAKRVKAPGKGFFLKRRWDGLIPKDKYEIKSDSEEYCEGKLKSTKKLGWKRTRNLKFISSHSKKEYNDVPFVSGVSDFTYFVS